MLPSADEAASALREIEAVRARTAGFHDYRAESVQLLIWGLAYVIGFSLSALFSAHLLLIWTIIVVAAISCGTIAARLTNPEISGIAWRYFALITAILAFVILVQVVMWPIAPEQGAMVAPLLVSVLYILRGIQLRPRYLIIGLILMILSVLGFMFLMPYFWWWMALATGGTLVVSGLWLRRI